MKRSVPTTAAVALLATALGCASTQNLRQSRGEGTTRYYEAPFERVWRAAVEAIEANGLRLDEADDHERFIAATHLPDRTGTGREDEVAVTADQGERIGVFVDSVAAGVWGVEVVTKRRFALDPNRLGWAEDIFYVIEQRLDGARVTPPPGAVDTVEADTVAGDRASGGSLRSD